MAIVYCTKLKIIKKEKKKDGVTDLVNKIV